MTRYLLDTHVLIEWAIDPSRLSTAARTAIGNGRSFVFVSAASSWEVAIKQRLGKLGRLGDIPTLITENRFEALPISVEHSLATAALPLIHRDPFDRMLIAQSMFEKLTLITRDREIEQYDVPFVAA